MSMRWPPLEVAIFFVVAMISQHWLFDGLTSETIAPGWFQVRFALPVVAALLIASLARGARGFLSLVGPLFKIPLAVRWWILAVGWVPLMGALATMTYPLLPGSPGPAPELRPGVLLPNLAFLIVVVQTALCDEFAWIGYAYNQVKRRWMPIAACILVGTIWGLWYQPMVMFGRAVAGTAIPVPLFVANMILTAVICVVLYNATRSALIVVAAQASGNFFYLMFPVLPQATDSWQPFAVFCAYQLLLVGILITRFGPALQPTQPAKPREIWLWPKRWRITPNAAPGSVKNYNPQKPES